MSLRKRNGIGTMGLVVYACAAMAACVSAKKNLYHDPMMDFSAIRSVAVMPLANLTSDRMSAERVRDVLVTSLLSTEALYVVPAGEIARGVSRAGIRDATAPSPDEVVRLGPIVKVDAVMTGVVREYGQVRSGNTSANVVSFSFQIIEVQTGKVIWTADVTKGGIDIWDRLFGGGGMPMNAITQEAVDDVIDALFRE